MTDAPKPMIDEKEMLAAIRRRHRMPINPPETRSDPRALGAAPRAADLPPRQRQAGLLPLQGPDGPVLLPLYASAKRAPRADRVLATCALIVTPVAITLFLLLK